MRVQSFTQPGEVVFNLVALLHLSSLLLALVFLSQMPDLGRDWRFWALIAGPVAFWAGALTVLARLWKSNYRPRLRFRKGLSITGSRACYEAYIGRFGRDAILWTIPAAVTYSLVSILLAVFLAGSG
jgi:hypothetical protein